MSTTTTPSQPSGYLVSDLLTIVVVRINATPIDLTAEWLAPGGGTLNHAEGDTAAIVVGYRFATTNGADPLGTWVTGDRSSCYAFRNAVGIGAITCGTAPSATNIDWPTLTLTGAFSWAAGVGACRSTPIPGLPAGNTSRNSTGSGPARRQFDTNGIVASVPAEADVLNAASGTSSGHCWTRFEILGEAA